MGRGDALRWLITDLGAHGMGADRSLFRRINHLGAATGWAHGIMAAYARWGGLVALTVVWARRWHDVLRSLAGTIQTGAAAVIGWGLTPITGRLLDTLGRTRPRRRLVPDAPVASTVASVPDDGMISPRPDVSGRAGMPAGGLRR
jgi:hypothetical protein